MHLSVSHRIYVTLKRSSNYCHHRLYVLKCVCWFCWDKTYGQITRVSSFYKDIQHTYHRFNVLNYTQTSALLCTSWQPPFVCETKTQNGMYFIRKQIWFVLKTKVQTHNNCVKMHVCLSCRITLLSPWKCYYFYRSQTWMSTSDEVICTCTKNTLISFSSLLLLLLLTFRLCHKQLHYREIDCDVCVYLCLHMRIFRIFNVRLTPLHTSLVYKEQQRFSLTNNEFGSSLS